MSSSTQAPPRPPKKTVLVTGAGGYIGLAVSQAFTRAGWDAYGLIRRAEGADVLLAAEVTPLIGAISADLGFLDTLLAQPATRPFDVVVSCTEQFPFDDHWAHVSALLTKVARHAQEKGVRPLVLVSSGCKDYGQTPRHGEPGLAAHTEESPLEPMDILAARTNCTLRVFEEPNKSLYDAAVIRPTPLFGYGGSYYGVLVETLSRFRGQGTTTTTTAAAARIKVPGHADAIYHGCHVDDCAEGYVALAAHSPRADVSGECFNISGYRYETVGEILAALAAEYDIPGIDSVPLPEVERPELRALAAVLGYSQWVDSAKIRALTGWTDKRKLFSENSRAYRLAYEAAARAGDDGVRRIRERVAGWAEAGISLEKK